MGDLLFGVRRAVQKYTATMNYTCKRGAHEFVLDPTGTYVLATEDIRIAEKGSIYSPGGLKKKWSRQHHAFIDALEKENYKLRYSGGLVGDINQILLKGGGLFTYPALSDNPDSKLRILFELKPMSLIIEQAGGMATNGYKNILDLEPNDMDARSPIYIGSKCEVKLAKDFLKQTAAARKWQNQQEKCYDVEC